MKKIYLFILAVLMSYLSWVAITSTIFYNKEYQPITFGRIDEETYDSSGDLKSPIVFWDGSSYRQIDYAIRRYTVVDMLNPLLVVNSGALERIDMFGFIPRISTIIMMIILNFLAGILFPFNEWAWPVGSSIMMILSIHIFIGSFLMAIAFASYMIGEIIHKRTFASQNTDPSISNTVA